MKRKSRCIVERGKHYFRGEEGGEIWSSAVVGQYNEV
jgi:hypothetical protein